MPTDPKALLAAVATLLSQAQAALDERDAKTPDGRLYTPREAAERVGVSAWTLCEYGRRGLIGRKVGSRWRFSDADFDLVRKGLP